MKLLIKTNFYNIINKFYINKTGKIIYKDNTPVKKEIIFNIMNILYRNMNPMKSATFNAPLFNIDSIEFIEFQTSKIYWKKDYIIEIYGYGKTPTEAQENLTKNKNILKEIYNRELNKKAELKLVASMQTANISYDFYISNNTVVLCDGSNLTDKDILNLRRLAIETNIRISLSKSNKYIITPKYNNNNDIEEYECKFIAQDKNLSIICTIYGYGISEQKSLENCIENIKMIDMYNWKM